jgi:hypothetical protein
MFSSACRLLLLVSWLGLAYYSNLKLEAIYSSEASFSSESHGVTTQRIAIFKVPFYCRKSYYRVFKNITSGYVMNFVNENHMWNILSTNHCETHYTVSTNFAIFCENLRLLVFVTKGESEFFIHVIYATWPWQRHHAHCLWPGLQV